MITPTIMPKPPTTGKRTRLKLFRIATLEWDDGPFLREADVRGHWTATSVGGSHSLARN